MPSIGRIDPSPTHVRYNRTNSLQKCQVFRRFEVGRRQTVKHQVRLVGRPLIPNFFDVALRDFGLSLGALALARPSRAFSS